MAFCWDSSEQELCSEPLLLPRARARFSVETILTIATAVFSAVLFSMAFLRGSVILCALMLFGGAAWTIFMSVFNVVVQKLAPDWVRSRVLAFYLFVFQGSVAAGSTLWGIVATAHERSSNAGDRRIGTRRACCCSHAPSSEHFRRSERVEPLDAACHVSGTEARPGIPTIETEDIGLANLKPVG